MEKANKIEKLLRQIFSKPPVFFFLLALAIVLVLFRGGNIVGGGEAGAAFYSLKRMFEMSKDSWAEVFFGMPSGLTVAGAPMFALLAFLQGINIPGFILQAGFFLIIAFLVLYSMYKFSSELFPKASKKLWIFSSLFYLFNPYSIMILWNRFLPNVLLFYSFLPLGLALFIKGLRRKDYRYLAIIAVFTALFSYAFAAPAQSILFWLLIFILSLYSFAFVDRKIFVFKYFLFALILWSIANSWWILQELYYRFSGLFVVVSGSIFTSSGNLATLRGLSESLGQISNLLLLKHGPFFTTPTSIPFRWPLFYSHPLLLALQWLVLIFVLFVAVRKRKDIWVRFLISLFVIAIFLSKGTSEPLGEAFLLAFKKISLLEFFRNPFEKLGLLIPLSLSPLFGLAAIEVELILAESKRVLKTLVRIFLVFYLFIFMGFPFFTGLVFTSLNYPANNPRIGYQVKVPKYYQDADKWLSSVSDDFRFMSLPIGGEGIFYNWEKGYAGVEQSAVLFSTPSFSYGTNAPYYRDIISSLERLFMEHTDFYKVARLLDIKFILFRPDFDFILSQMRDPQTLDKLLEERVRDKEAKLSFIKEFGPLKFYTLSEDSISPKFFIGKQTIESNRDGDLEDIFWGKAEKNDLLVSQGSNLSDNNLKASVIHPLATFNIKGFGLRSSTADPTILPFVNRNSTDRIYPLIILKERITELFTPRLADRLEYKITLLGKRVVEAKLGIDSKDLDAVRKSLLLYQESFKNVIDKVRSESMGVNSDKGIWRRDFLRQAFGTHLSILEDLKRSGVVDKQTISFIDETEKLVREASSALFIIPEHELAVESTFSLDSRIVYQFKVNAAGDYELIFPEKQWERYFELPDKALVQVNNEVEERNVRFTDEGVNFGNFFFNEGINEIGINLPETHNLVENKNEIVLKASHEKTSVEFPIRNFDPRTPYRTSFDYYVRSGSSPSLAFVQNTDKIVDEKYENVFTKKLTQDNYWFDFRKFSEDITPSTYADSAKLVFTIERWNDCDQFFKLKKSKCSDENFRKTLDRQSEVIIKNLKVEKGLPREPVLRKIFQTANLVSPEPKITSTMINPTKYLISINGAENPFILVFSELYSPGWKIYRTEGNTSTLWESWRKEPLEAKHYFVNGYANAWKIDEIGDFTLMMEYWPQRILYLGYLVSGLFIISGIVYLMLWRFKN